MRLHSVASGLHGLPVCWEKSSTHVEVSYSRVARSRGKPQLYGKDDENSKSRLANAAAAPKQMSFGHCGKRAGIGIWFQGECGAKTGGIHELDTRDGVGSRGGRSDGEHGRRSSG
jgi:hypothetical protein